MKIAINKCYGGFNLSKKGFERWIELGAKVKEENLNDKSTDYDICKYKSENNPNIYEYTIKYTDDIENGEDFSIRSNFLLIQTIEELGKEANGPFSELCIVEIPDGVDYQIEEYDGNEWISEKHRTWH